MAEKEAGPSLEGMFYGSVTVGERGQVVIPADARKQFKIKPGDKLLVFRSPTGTGLVLVGVDNMRAMMSHMQRWEQMLGQLEQDQGSQEEPGKE